MCGFATVPVAFNTTAELRVPTRISTKLAIISNYIVEFAPNCFMYQKVILASDHSPRDLPRAHKLTKHLHLPMASISSTLRGVKCSTNNVLCVLSHGKWDCAGISNQHTLNLAKYVFNGQGIQEEHLFLKQKLIHKNR